MLISSSLPYAVRGEAKFSVVRDVEFYKRDLVILDQSVDTPNTAMNAHFIFDLIRAYEKRCFPWMQSLEDRDLIAIIGTHQDENKDGISCKQLYLAGIAPVATIQRRIRRLIKLGVLRKRQSNRDARVFYICLSGSAEGSVESYAALLKSSALSLNNDASFAPVAFSDRSALRNSSSPQLPLRKVG